MAEELTKKEQELAKGVAKMVNKNVGKMIVFSTLSEGIPPIKLPGIFAIVSTSIIVLMKMGHLDFGEHPMTEEEAKAFLEKYQK